MQTIMEKTEKSISQKLCMTHIVQFLYGKYPKTEFDLKILPYNGRNSLKISWYGLPVKKDLKVLVDMYTGSRMDENGVIQKVETLFALPSGRMVMVYWPFDFILLNQKEIRFI